MRRSCPQRTRSRQRSSTATRICEYQASQEILGEVPKVPELEIGEEFSFEGFSQTLHFTTIFSSEVPKYRWWFDRFNVAGQDKLPLVRNYEADAVIAPALLGVDFDDLDLDVVDAVTAALYDADTEVIRKVAYNPNEYRDEAEIIVALSTVDQLTADSLWAVFASQFGSSSFGDRYSSSWPYLLSWLDLDIHPLEGR